LRIKEQETRLTLQEHDDDEDFDQRVLSKDQYFQSAGSTGDHLNNLSTTDIDIKSMCMNTQVKYISEVGARLEALRYSATLTER